MVYKELLKINKKKTNQKKRKEKNAVVSPYLWFHFPVSVTHVQLQSENIKWKIPEINNS